MRQFQGSLGPIQELQPSRTPAGQKPHSADTDCNDRAIDAPLSWREWIETWGGIYAAAGVLVAAFLWVVL